MLKILGIESSCDETAAAVLEDGTRILSSSVSSQFDIHARFGGVVPELASREHLRAIVPIVRGAMEQAQSCFSDLDAIAATQGPGLMGSLLVGLTYAKALCFAHKIPLIAVHHLEGHMEAALLDAKGGRAPIAYPALALIVSGGHTHLFECLEEGRYRLEGRTRDDAAGEAYDKVAKLLGYGYPGGPVVDALAPYGDAKAFRLTSPKMSGNASDFSFSGMKTAVLRWTETVDTQGEIQARKAFLKHTPQPSTEQWLALSSAPTLGVLASFQRAVIHELIKRLEASAERIGARAILISGGVASNQGLRRAIAAHGFTVPVYFPTPQWSTDNGVMIALAGHRKFLRGEFADMSANAKANLPLA